MVSQHHTCLPYDTMLTMSAGHVTGSKAGDAASHTGSQFAFSGDYGTGGDDDFDADGKDDFQTSGLNNGAGDGGKISESHGIY